MRSPLRCLVFLGASFVAAAQSPPARVTVSPAGGAGTFHTVQDAIDHATGPTIIAIQPGTYKEKIKVARQGIWLIGTGSKPDQVVLFKSGTVTVDADDFAAENLTIANTWWDDHPLPEDASQAVALQLSSDRAVLDQVRLISGQDTLYAGSRTCRSITADAPCAASRQYFSDCYIEGNVDYIFGDAKAVFQHCELHSRPHPTVMLTAQSRRFPAEDSGYYFLDCRITGADNGNRVVLGRPWRDYATVYFIHTEVDQKLAPEGWSEWDGRLKTATYREYDSFGKGVNGGHRVIALPPLTPQGKAALTPEALLQGIALLEPGEGSTNAACPDRQRPVAFRSASSTTRVLSRQHAGLRPYFHQAHKQRASPAQAAFLARTPCDS